MSIKAGKLLRKRNKHLVFGYCRENENRHNHSVYPEAIIRLFLLYTIVADDQLQENNKMDKAVILIKPYEIIVPAAGYRYPKLVSVVGINQAQNGIHI